MRFLAAFALILSLTSTAQAQRAYEGQEAAALRCANTLALTAVTLNRGGLIGGLEKDVLLGITQQILDRHVSGTWRQKRAALAVMRDRRSVEATLKDYRRNSERCLRQFPIN